MRRRRGVYGAGGAFCRRLGCCKYVSTLNAEYPLGELDIPPAGPRGNGGEIARGPMGPSRLEVDKPVIAAIGRRRGRRHGTRDVVRFPRDGGKSVFRGLLPALGRAADRGGTVRLPRIVGKGRAIEIILTGRKVPAAER